MLLLFAAVSAAASPPSPVRAEQRARATILVLQAHRASPETWEPRRQRNQREIVRDEPNGVRILLRLTEFE